MLNGNIKIYLRVLGGYKCSWGDMKKKGLKFFWR